MPYKSDAQRRKFHAMLAEGKISKSVVDEFDKASKGMSLPEHKGDGMRHEKVLGKTKHGHTIIHSTR